MLSEGKNGFHSEDLLGFAGFSKLQRSSSLLKYFVLLCLVNKEKELYTVIFVLTSQGLNRSQEKLIGSDWQCFYLPSQFCGENILIFSWL